MDKEKRKQLLRLEKENRAIDKKKWTLFYDIQDFKDSLSDNPTDEELDKLVQLEEEHEALDKKWEDTYDKCIKLKEEINNEDK